MALSTTEQLAALATALGVGGLLSKGLDLWAARGKAKREEPAELIRALGELSGTLSEGGQKLAQGFIDEFTYLRKQIDGLRAQHGACEAEVAGLKTRLDASERERERERAELRATIDRLMAEHPPAVYGPTLLAGVVPPKP